MKLSLLVLPLFVLGCTSDPPPPASVPPPDVAYGKYLVDHVMNCGDCHTPHSPNAKYLSGVECFVDAHPGCLHSSNLTNDPTGIGKLTDAQLKAVLVKGTKPDGSSLADVMPYWLFSALTDRDADSIVAYLRTVPPVAHQMPPNDPPFANPQPVPLATLASLPIATSGPQAGASSGRYLAALSCLGCHSPDNPVHGQPPQDLSRAYQGGRVFKAASIGLPVPPFPEDIYAPNLTPDKSGLADWNEAQLVSLLRTGLDAHGMMLCPPMPFGPTGAYAGLTDEDANAIASYLLHLSAARSTVPSQCFAPMH